jgi:hypothetical protein
MPLSVTLFHRHQDGQLFKNNQHINSLFESMRSTVMVKYNLDQCRVLETELSSFSVILRKVLIRGSHEIHLI